MVRGGIDGTDLAMTTSFIEFMGRTLATKGTITTDAQGLHHIDHADHELGMCNHVDDQWADGSYSWGNLRFPRNC